MKLKRGDNIIMLNGKDRGKTGKISMVIPTIDRVVVEGLNLIKKNVRAKKQGQKGQIINKERAVSASSVALICKSCGKMTRIGYKFDGDLPTGRHGNKIRICRKCKAEN